MGQGIIKENEVIVESNKTTWTESAVQAIYEQPFNTLLDKAHTLHKANHDENVIQAATLLSIKTGACPEDCSYCSQSGRYETAVEKEKLLSLEAVIERAKEAKAQGATRFCMGAAWRSPPAKAMPALFEMIEAVKALGMETCMTLGMLDDVQAQQLSDAGLDYYNHNIDTSPSYYNKVITSRTFQDRLDTIERVKEAGMRVCCGGILGLGESRTDRIEFLCTLANLSTPPESVPINRLIRVAGTPLADAVPLDGLELVRTIATARLIMPASVIRLTAGRTEMSDELQALCYFAGANSIFLGDKLLTSPNPETEDDVVLLQKLGISMQALADA
ncbi:MAG: biotin synthase BioB [Legionellaceae bacterium]|nr:biotin synthase BioB [Legionellaceae bacterium]